MRELRERDVVHRDDGATAGPGDTQAFGSLHRDRTDRQDDLVILKRDDLHGTDHLTGLKLHPDVVRVVLQPVADVESVAWRLVGPRVLGLLFAKAEGQTLTLVGAVKLLHRVEQRHTERDAVAGELPDASQVAHLVHDGRVRPGHLAKDDLTGVSL